MAKCTRRSAYCADLTELVVLASQYEHLPTFHWLPIFWAHIWKRSSFCETIYVYLLFRKMPLKAIMRCFLTRVASRLVLFAARHFFVWIFRGEEKKHVNLFFRLEANLSGRFECSHAWPRGIAVRLSSRAQPMPSIGCSSSSSSYSDTFRYNTCTRIVQSNATFFLCGKSLGM